MKIVSEQFTEIDCICSNLRRSTKHVLLTDLDIGQQHIRIASSEALSPSLHFRLGANMSNLRIARVIVSTTSLTTDFQDISYIQGKLNHFIISIKAHLLDGRNVPCTVFFGFPSVSVTKIRF